MGSQSANPGLHERKRHQRQSRVAGLFQSTHLEDLTEAPQENDRLERNTSSGSSQRRSHSILAWTCISGRSSEERLQRNSISGLLHRFDSSCLPTLPGRSNSTGHVVNRGRSETYSRRRSYHVG